MDINVAKTSGELRVRSFIKMYPATRVSRGGLDEINPDDIVYGEYADGLKEHGTWIDLVYLNDDILRTFSGAVDSQHPVIQELQILLRDETAFYLIPVKEVPLGFAFKRTDIMDIKVSSLISGNEKHAPSCVWTMYFKDDATRTLEADYQSYFAYGNTIRPKSMTNVSILDTVFDDSKNREGDNK